MTTNSPAPGAGRDVDPCGAPGAGVGVRGLAAALLALPLGGSAAAGSAARPMAVHEGHPVETDEELMLRYRATGDGEAFRALFERHAGRLRRVMSRYLRSPDDVEDLVQKTYLNVHRARRDYRPGHSFRSWLFAIALNVRREHFRQLQRRPEGALEWDGPEPAEGSHSGDVVRRLLLERALGRLSVAQREVIRLHWFDGLTFPEIADLVGAKLSAVKVRAHRGYKVLAAALEERDGGRQDPATLAFAKGRNR